MELTYKIPSDLTKPVDEGTPSPNSATAKYDSGYMDGTCKDYEGANPGRDQDRSRVDECSPASFVYKPSGAGVESENTTGSMEGY